jgi:hypothetical protein
VGIEQCELVDLPKIGYPQGNITFIEGNHHVPFEIKRVFYIYDVPTGESRGSHAHKKLEQFLICLAGSFKVSVDDGKDKKTFHLNRPWVGLYLPPMIWGWEGDFDPGSVCLVLASLPYSEEDYFRDYEKFLAAARMAH